MADTPVKKNSLLDGISDIVIEKQNAKQGKMYNSILSKFIKSLKTQVMGLITTKLRHLKEHTVC